LLLMDFQNAVVEMFGDSAGAALHRAAEAKAAARAHGIPVIYVRVAFRDGCPEVSARNQSFSAIAGRGGFSLTDEATQIHETLKPEPGDVIVLKKRVSAFTGSDLDVVVRSLEVDHLVLTGVATSGVVLSTLREAADLDFRLTVLADACGDNDEEVHRVLSEKLFPRQAAVVSVSDWIAGLPAT
jgi:nicotinamidase-related amidase